MLELKNITKEYKTEGFTQKALDKVSINFRKCEFASILGPSGSGKTTMLNIIGGLDQYDSGDLIINGISTKKFKDRDWDTYRNHRVGFVFQSYNLIPHQSVLSNVELALTLSGVSSKERKKRAKKALEEVGLKDHINKRPTQLSGGQMQRVAIARALVNDPEILLADEPTGALDSSTSESVMDILSKVAEDRLVIMVTHNPELANKYSTRIISLKDGKVTSDTKPFDGKEEYDKNDKSKTKKTSMSFLTALSLSLNNLMTKKGRTILTAFAGSIGIIGIALILSLSNGVNQYITDIQKETMLSYPIMIEEEAMDMSTFLETGRSISEGETKIEHDKDAVYSNSELLELASSMTTSLYKNNLTDFKKYLDNKDSEINKYVGDNGIIYGYDTVFDVYNYDPDGVLVNSNGSTFVDKINASQSLRYMNASFGRVVSNTIFTELMSGKGDELISKAIYEEYDLVTGSWPTKANEVILMLDSNNEVSTTTLYYLGLLPSKEYKEILDNLENEEEFSVELKKISYEDILNTKFKLLTESDYYVKNSNGLYDYVKESNGKVEELIKSNGLELKVTGIVKQKEDSKNKLINSNVGYTRALTDWIIEHTDNSQVVKDQENSKNKSVITGLRFSVTIDAEKAKEAKKYLQNLGVTDKANLATYMMKQLYSGNQMMMGQMMNMSETELAYMMDEFLKNPDDTILTQIYDNFISTGTYEKNMELFGKVYRDSPSIIQIYADSFEDKDGIVESIDNYNNSKEEEDKITYTDYIGLLMSSVTTIINAITYVLIAFVSISLVVSSIMIAIITYISVLERTKEIGILRAIGASKKDVKRVFNAETFIEGTVAGVMGIVVTILLNIPINAIIYNLTNIKNMSILPVVGAISLIIISIILTVIAGLIPSSMASKKDPVESLRTE